MIEPYKTFTWPVLNNRSNRQAYDKNEHHSKAQKIAEECVVLLKNEDDILPIKKSAKMAVTC